MAEPKKVCVSSMWLPEEKEALREVVSCEFYRLGEEVARLRKSFFDLKEAKEDPGFREVYNQRDHAWNLLRLLIIGDPYFLEANREIFNDFLTEASQ
jgi:hypothetical protein